MTREKHEQPQPQPSTETVPDYTAIVGLKRTKIVEIVDEFVSVRKQIEVLETRKKELAADGAKLLIKAGVKSVMVGELRTTVLEGMSRATVSARKLFELGVSEKIIQKATTPGKPWTSLKVTEEGEKKEGE